MEDYVRPSATYSLLELISLFQGQRVRLGDHRNDIDDFCEFLEHNDIDLAVSTGAHSNQQHLQASRCARLG